MRYDLIKGVKFGELNSNPDRRGTIAIFYLKDIPNIEYLYDSAALTIRQIIALLNDIYCMDWYDSEITSYAIGEAQNCWVSKSLSSPLTLVVTHKYWGQDEIDAFYGIVTILAKLHKWELIP